MVDLLTTNKTMKQGINMGENQQNKVSLIYFKMYEIMLCLHVFG